MENNEPKKIKTNTIALFSIAIFTMLTSVMLNANTSLMARYPKGYIPFWSQQKGGYETSLINTQQIVRLVPIYDEDDKGRLEIAYIECYLSDGVKITVEEDFDEFYSRIRTAQIK